MPCFESDLFLSENDKTRRQNCDTHPKIKYSSLLSRYNSNRNLRYYGYVVSSDIVTEFTLKGPLAESSNLALAQTRNLALEH
jgi:hypothetical protein